MGAEVERVSEDPPLDPALPDDSFGPWFRRERRLRGLSVYFAATRTKISPSRIESIERGETLLSDDGHGRGTARQLAAAIGADPDEAASRVERVSASTRGREGRLGTGQPAAWALRIGVVAALLGLAGWAASLLLDAQADREPPGVVYKQDYLEDLLEDGKAQP